MTTRCSSAQAASSSSSATCTTTSPSIPRTALTPIAGVAKVQIAVAVPTSLGISTLAQFVALEARQAARDELCGRARTSPEFVFDGFVKEKRTSGDRQDLLDRDITKSPLDLGENRIQLSMQSYAAMRIYAQTGKIKFIAINDRVRSPIAPDLPSVVEAGFPSLLASPVLGLLGPRGMPTRIAPPDRRGRGRSDRQDGC